jgi:serine/threonine-protein kinase
MAAIYLVRDTRDNQVYALKVLPTQFTHDPQFKDRFFRECKTVSQLRHEAIVPVYDYGEADDIPYMVMRYLPGGTLADRLSLGPIDPDEAIRILRPIAEALDYAHQQGVVHRDVKPANIYFDEKGNAYLGDFGVVQLIEATRSFTGSAIIGTPAYMSPEQVKGGRKIDGRSDVYALGIVLYEMLTGKAPYEGETPTQQMMKHVLEPVPHIRDQSPQISEILERILIKALSKEPGERYATASEFIQAAATLNPPPRPTIYDPPTKKYINNTVIPGPAPPRRKPVLLFAGLGMVSVCVLLAASVAAAAYFGFPLILRPAPTETSTEVVELDSPTPAPTDTVLPTTPAPSATPKPSVTPLPEISDTPTPPPTDTFTPPPTNTPPPTSTPIPTHTPTNTPTYTPTYTPTPVRNSSIVVFVYWDRDDDGLWDSSDYLLTAVLELYAGSSCSGPVIATPIAFLGYKFDDLPEGTYCVKVINNSVEDVGTCALGPRHNRNEKVYSLRANQDLEDLDQGFPYVCR